MNALFQKASELTLNKQYKNYFIECSIGKLPKGITQDNNTFSFEKESITPKDEKELCSVFIKWFKRIDTNPIEENYIKPLFPSLCCLKEVPSKSRDGLIRDYCVEKQEYLCLTDDEMSQLYSTIWTGIQYGFIDISSIIVRDYKIVDIPYLVKSENGFLITNDANANVDFDSLPKSSQKRL